MKTNGLILLTLLLAVAACGPEDILVPDISGQCSPATNTHPDSAAFQTIIDGYADKGIVGMSVFVHDPGKGDWNGAMGFSEIESQQRMMPCQLGYSASIIKTFISVIILQLEEEGKLSLDDQVTKYLDNDLLEGLPNVETVTIRHLLLNRSGMPDVFEVDFLLDFLNQPARQYSPEELLGFLKGVTPASAPGTDYYYSDANFLLLSLIIEKLEGDLRQVYQQRVFDAAGMEHAWLIDEPDQIPAGVSASYWNRFGDGRLENVSDYQIALAAGLDGTDGLILTVDELDRFMEVLTSGGLISPVSLSEMMKTLEIPAEQRSQNYEAYGLGIGQVQVAEKTWIGSFGNHVGSAAIMLFDRDTGTRLSILMNTGTFFNDPIKQVFFYELIADLEGLLE